MILFYGIFEIAVFIIGSAVLVIFFESVFFLKEKLNLNIVFKRFLIFVICGVILVVFAVFIEVFVILSFVK